MSKTMITAHSGSDGTPDNSIEFVKYAVSTNANAFEIDILLADGELKITHDLPSHNVPTLNDVFSIIKDYTIDINCDLKVRGLETMVYKLAKQYNLTDRIIFSGYVNLDTLKDNPDIANNIRVYLNAEDHVKDFYENLDSIENFDVIAANELAIKCTQNNILAVNVSYKRCTDNFIRVLHNRGVSISVWTVNELDDIKRFLSHNVLNITTRNVKNSIELFN